jgi:hypothetical protein
MDKEEKRYDPAVEAQAELERDTKRAGWMAWTLKGIGALLVFSAAKLHLSTLAGKVAGGIGPLCFLASSIVSMWARSKESGPEYISIVQPKDDRTSRVIRNRFARR